MALSLKRKHAAGPVVRRNSSSVTAQAAHSKQTVGIKGVKARKPGKRAPVARTANVPAKRSRLGDTTENSRTVSTVGLKGAKKGGQRGMTSSNLRKTSPRAISSQGIYSSTAQTGVAHTSLGSSGTGKLYTGGKGIPFKGNARRVASSVPGAGQIPAVVRRAASRKAPGGGSKAGSASMVTRLAKILSK